MDEIINGLGLDIELSKIHDADPKNFQLDQLGGWFGYTPKHDEFIIQPLVTKNQGQVNSCVTQAVAGQAEIDTSIEMSAGDIGANLVQQGLMNGGGTSIRSAEQLYIDKGIAEESVVPSQNTTFEAFTSPAQLTQVAADNAATHRDKSYWQTTSLDTILQQIDNGKVGVTGCYWYPDYNNTGANPLQPHDTTSTSGHCFKVVGYKKNYNGFPVVVFHNSFGANWGDKGFFYVKFADFSKVIQFSTYFTLPIQKDLASWLSLNAHLAIIENGGPKVYIIEGNYKRWVPDVGLMDILGILPQNLHHDTDNMLALILEGPPMSLADVPPVEIDNYKRKIQLLNNPTVIAQLHQQYPNIF